MGRAGGCVSTGIGLAGYVLPCPCEETTAQRQAVVTKGMLSEVAGLR